MGTIVEDNQTVLAYIGAGATCIVLIRLILGIARSFRTFFLSPLINLGVNPKSLGAWAVVTGATDGIGKAYAKALAKKGMNIVLLSRTPAKLKDTANELVKYNVEVRCVTVDFSASVDIYDRIEKELEGLDIGVLINNVGMSYEHPEWFHQVGDREHFFHKLLTVNIYPVTYMSAIVIPRMADKGKGAVVNIGSSSSHGFPMLTVYAATKAYVDALSQNLAVEYADKGLIIQSVMPHVVCSNMSRVKRPSFFQPTADAFVKSAVVTIGLEPVTTGYFSHWLTDCIASCIPQSARMQFLFNASKKLRGRALKRKAASKSD